MNFVRVVEAVIIVTLRDRYVVSVVTGKVIILVR